MVELEWSFLMSIWRNWKELKTWSDVYSEVFRSNSYQIRGGLCAGEEIIKLAAFVRRDMGWVLQNDEPMEINNFLNIFERFWEILRDFERFWEILRDFGRFWEILRDQTFAEWDPSPAIVKARNTPLCRRAETCGNHRSWGGTESTILKQCKG